MLTCSICGNSANNTAFVVREMMFGRRDEFEYFQCGRCACLQIGTIPADLKSYYPKDYYSHAPIEQAMHPRARDRLKTLMRRQRLEARLGSRKLLGNILLLAPLRPLPVWVRQGFVQPASKILDVGSGSGQTLLYLRGQGFTNLAGIDPFVERDVHYGVGLKISKAALQDVDDRYDFIMLHHTLEHMPEPKDALRHIARIMREGAHLLIRIPVVPCYAWNTYRTNWVQIDAPRHLFIFSREGLAILCEQAGLEIAEVIFDSTAFQFWGSEQYQRGIPLMDARSRWQNERSSLFSDKDMCRFEESARKLNREFQGDQACFFIRKKKEAHASGCSQSWN